MASFGQSFNATVDRLCNASLIRGIAGNAVYTTLLITALTLILLLALAGPCVKGYGWKKFARMGFFLTLLVGAVLFLHRCALLRRERAVAAQHGVQSVFHALDAAQQTAPPSYLVRPLGTAPFPTPGGQPQFGASAPVTGAGDSPGGLGSSTPWGQNSQFSRGFGGRQYAAAREDNVANPHSYVAFGDDLVLEDVQIAPTRPKNEATGPGRV
jgi:hypothetical protein